MTINASGLVVRQLSVSFGAVKAVEDISLQIRPGQCVGIIGANGAGKTSLLRGISGLSRAAGKSQVQLHGVVIDRWSAVSRARAGLGHVLEHRHIFPALSVRDNLDIVPRKGNSSSQTQFERVLDMFPELLPNIDRPAGALSGGQQQFLAFGRALMAEPTILLLDEPTTGLAPMLVRRIGEAVNRLVAEGIGILIVEQALSVIEMTSSLVHVLSHGRFVASVDPRTESLTQAAHKAYFA
jgi:ABC-type branched-subunit amino acid transport system ATPase component